MTRFTRRYRFAAAHRLHSEKLTAAENAELFGKCNNPYGHGHDYLLEVSVCGDVDPSTGRVISPAQLDEYVKARIVDQFDHRNMNTEVPALAGRIPTTEVAAETIEDLLISDWPKDWSARLDKIRIYETKNNIFETTHEAR
jgi:6-pyruvoyltetrahydropterin/6-carboxytetrahydropterin synthase